MPARTGMGWPSGRSRRWSGAGPASSKTRTPSPRRRSSGRWSDDIVPDPNKQHVVEPRLAQLLGLEDRPPRDETNLFAAWRLFFERMSDADPVILIFEDIHWADSALLDFIEHLLDWSRERPIFILTLSRPELLDRRPTWGAGKRGFTSIFLEPLPPEAMEMMLAGPLPGFPATSSRRSCNAPRGFRSTRWRRSGCSSTEV